MKIWIVRHGQTRLNEGNRMQGLVDEPLNDTGVEQAQRVREMLDGQRFDAVFTSPLCRAVSTAEIITGLPRERLHIDPRITEVDFGSFDGRPIGRCGIGMSLYWLYPEIFPAPHGVETVKSMVERSHSFLRELEKTDYENVLIVCHGGIIRALRGYLEDRPNGIRWRPRPKNCEVLVYESENGIHRTIPFGGHIDD